MLEVKFGKDPLYCSKKVISLEIHTIRKLLIAFSI